MTNIRRLGFPQFGSGCWWSDTIDLFFIHVEAVCHPSTMKMGYCGIMGSSSGSVLSGYFDFFSSILGSEATVLGLLADGTGFHNVMVLFDLLTMIQILQGHFIGSG